MVAHNKLCIPGVEMTVRNGSINKPCICIRICRNGSLHTWGRVWAEDVVCVEPDPGIRLLPIV